MTQANVITEKEAQDLLYLLDDEDKLAEVGGVGAARMGQLWRRLHLWLLAKSGDKDAEMLLKHEFGAGL